MTGDADNTVRLDDADALIWAVERDPRLASTISSIVVFDSRVDPIALRIRLERASRLVLRMRQRVVGNPASLSPPRWELDPDFDLGNHFDVIDCPGDGTLRAALDRAGPFVDAPFDRDRPLFQFLLMQGVDGDKSALVTKAHHAIADGMGMLQIQLEVFDFEPDTDDPEMPPAPEAEPLSATERLGNAVEFERDRTIRAALNLGAAVFKAAAAPGGRPLDQMVDTVGSALAAVRSVEPLSPALTARSAETWHDVVAVSLTDLKAAGARAGTRMNPAFVAGVAKGLGLFHERVEQPCQLLRMGMPISVRAEGDDATGNHLVPIRLETPLDAEQPDHLIEIVHALIEAQRDDPNQAIIGPAQALVARLPSQLSGLAFAQVLKGSDFLTSNLAGSPVPMWIGSAKVDAQYPFGPTSAAAVNVTLLSYIDEAHIGISIDAEATDQPELLADCIRNGLAWIIDG